MQEVGSIAVNVKTILVFALCGVPFLLNYFFSLYPQTKKPKQVLRLIYFGTLLKYLTFMPIVALIFYIDLVPAVTVFLGVFIFQFATVFMGLRHERRLV